MKTLLFLELTVIFASSFLLTVQLFFNCLNETHFLALGSLGIVTAAIVLFFGYNPSPNTVALYAALAFCSFGFFMFHLTIGYIVYDFGAVSRGIFIENNVSAILKTLPKYAERSNDKYGSYEYVCRSEAFTYVPAKIENAHWKESCYGPLAFLIFDKTDPLPTFRCEAKPEGWLVETNQPYGEGYLCMDTRRKVLQNEFSKEGEVSCR